MFLEQSHIEHRLTEEQVILLSDDKRIGAANTDVITAAILFGETTVKQYLASRYYTFFSSWTTPATTPPLLTQLATDCAIYFLFTRQQGIVELWKTNYENALKSLQMIADGKQDLIGSDGTNYTLETDQGSQNQVHLPRSNTQNDDPQFSRTSLYNYMRNAPHLSEP